MFVRAELLDFDDSEITKRPAQHHMRIHKKRLGRLICEKKKKGKISII